MIRERLDKLRKELFELEEQRDEISKRIEEIEKDLYYYEDPDSVRYEKAYEQFKQDKDEGEIDINEPITFNIDDCFEDDEDVIWGYGGNYD